jgi:hypothetical protein
MRKIKTFNVDEDVYNGLLATFKKYGVNASLSSFVNNCLIELLTHLQEVEQASKNNPAYKIPMSFIISDLMKGLKNKKSVLPIYTGVGMDPQEVYEEILLTKWEDEYEARQRGISVEMYSYLQDGGYFLAPNKQYLIDEKTGKKYVVMPTGDGKSVLGEIKEE